MKYDKLLNPTCTNTAEGYFDYNYFSEADATEAAEWRNIEVGPYIDLAIKDVESPQPWVDVNGTYKSDTTREENAPLIAAVYYNNYGYTMRAGSNNKSWLEPGKYNQYDRTDNDFGLIDAYGSPRTDVTDPMILGDRLYPDDEDQVDFYGNKYDFCTNSYIHNIDEGLICAIRYLQIMNW